MASDAPSLFDIVEGPYAKVPAHARRCDVCNRPRPKGGLPGEVNIQLEHRRAYICSEAHRLYWTGGWIEAAPWRQRAA